MSEWDSKRNAETGIDLAFISRYSKLFNHRFGIHGEQIIGRDGKVRYRNNIPDSVDIFMLRKMLYAERTFASYGCEKDGWSKWTMFDLDIPPHSTHQINCHSGLTHFNR